MSKRLEVAQQMRREGKTYKEIGRVLNLTAYRVSQILRHAAK